MVELDGNFTLSCGAWNGLPLNTYTECPGRNVPDFGKMFLKL